MTDEENKVPEPEGTEESADKVEDSTASETAGAAAEEAGEAAVAPEADASDSAEGGKKKKKKPRNKKKTITIWVIVLVVLAALIAGFMVWHSKPTFCNAICHTPMDSYVEGYYSGNTDLMITAHANATDKNGDAITCLTCHEPKIGEQVTEAIHWVGGSYDYNYDTRQLGQRRNYASYDNSGVTNGDGFCINDACHTINEMEAVDNLDEYSEYKPHENHLGKLDCMNCHRMHEQSVMYCTDCHSQVAVPDGWVSYSDDPDDRDIMEVEA